METGIETYSPEWFKLRQGRFTASNAWKLVVEPRTKQAKESGELSETTNTYILEKVWETLSGLSTLNVDNAATQWGVEQEPNAVKWYEKITGNTTKGCGLFERENVAMLATPDRLCNEEGLVEVKCPFNGANHLNHCFITNDEYFKTNHKEHYWQMQAQMWIAEKKWCDFVSFDPRIESNLGLFIYRVNRNHEDIMKLVEKTDQAKEVYDNYLKMFSGENNKTKEMQKV